MLTSRRVATLLAATLLSTAGVIADGSATARAAPPPVLFRGSGFATQVVGGSVPAHSGTTALVTLGCTRRAGIVRQNRVAASQIEGTPVRVGASETTLRSLRVRGGFASDTLHEVDSVRVGANPNTFLRVNSLRVASRAAIVDKTGQATSTTRIGSAQLVIAGRAESISLRELRQGVTIPGVAIVELGANRTSSDRDSAHAFGIGLRITRLSGPPTVVTVGRAVAGIDETPRFGVFRGGANISVVRTARDVVTSGPLVRKPMPCQGTDGAWLRNFAADATAPPDTQIENGQARVYSETFRRFATARSQARVEEALLLDGRMHVEGLRAAANVRKNANGTRQANANGTSVDEVTFDGRPLSLVPGRPVEIPGVAKITFRSERRTRTGIAVTGLRIELLTGRFAVLELANAVSAIR